MAIDFYAILREEYGPYNSPYRLKPGEMKDLVEQLKLDMVRYLSLRVGPDYRIAGVMGTNRATVNKLRNKAGVPNYHTARRLKEGADL